LEAAPLKENCKNQPATDRPLRICLLSYRGNPYCGGQGVYIRQLSHALCSLGHEVDVISGPPYPHLSNGARLHRLSGLDLFNPEDLFRTPSSRELLDPINLIEWLGVTTMGFPEPMTFGLRIKRYFKSPHKQYDVIHDNQSLSYGIWSLAKRIPLVATIHHPITIDRDTAIKAQSSFRKKIQQLRWYSFIRMQKRVVPTLKRILTVSRCGRDDISREFRIPKENISVVPNGIDMNQFHPITGVYREPYRLMVTTSADTPLKGLCHLMTAISGLVPRYPKVHLVVVGNPPKAKSFTNQLIRDLGLRGHIRFTGRITGAELVRQYARTSAVVVPSIYEGFGLPAGEAMACSVPVISTDGGALPELLGKTGILVPAADSVALAKAIALLFDHPDLAHNMGRAGRQRIAAHFTWGKAARKTADNYHRVIHDYRRSAMFGSARDMPRS
jgi:glycosyltransferase involved in cell wall biosynthesis